MVDLANESMDQRAERLKAEGRFELDDSTKDNAFSAKMDQRAAQLSVRRDRKAILSSKPDFTPEQQASAIRKAREYGASVDLVANNMDQFPDKIAPADGDVTQQFQQDQIYAAVIKDSVREMSGTERMINSISQSWNAGQLTTELAEIEWDINAGIATQEQIDRGNQIDTEMSKMVDFETSYVSGIPAAVVENIHPYAEIAKDSLPFIAGGATTGAAMGAVAGPGGMTAGGLTGAGLGWRVGSGVGAFKLEAPLATREFKKMGIDPVTAKGAGHLVGIFSAGLESFGLNYLLKTIPGADRVIGGMSKDALSNLILKSDTAREAVAKYGAKVSGGNFLESSGRLAKTMGGSAVVEGGTEALQEVIFVLGSLMAAEVSEDRTGEAVDVPTLAESLPQIWDMAVKGSQGGLGFATVSGGGKFVHDLTRAKKAEKTAESIKEISDLAKENKVSEISPETNEEFIRQVQQAYGDDAAFIVDRDVAERFFQDEELLAQMPETAARLEAAIEMGGDIDIPMSEFITYAARSEGIDDLIPYIKVAPDDMTLQEAKSMRQELDDQYITDANIQDSNADANDRVYADMREQLIRSGQSDTAADTGALLWSKYFNANAERLGEDPHALMRSFNASVRHEDLRAQMRDGYDRDDGIIDSIRAGKRATDADIFGNTFGEELARRGGLKDSGGELAARDLDKRVQDAGGKLFGGRKISQERGMSLDDAISMGIEEGFLGADQWGQLDTNDLLNYLDDELAGSPLRRMDGFDEDALSIRDDYDRMAERIDRMGLKVDELTNAQIKEIVGVTRFNQEIENVSVWHGSPHDFDQFKTSQIGTGEGAQAYGHGLYFSESEDVARGYKDRLSPNKSNLPNGPDTAAKTILRTKGDDEGERIFREMYSKLGLSDDELSASLAAARKELTDPSRGRMYEAQINASPDEFLDWDLPLSEQTKTVQSLYRKQNPFTPEDDALLEALGNPVPIDGAAGFGDIAGEQLYRDLTRQAGDRWLAQVKK